jgi:trigger factor
MDVKVDVEQVEACVRRLTIEVPADQVGREFSARYRELQKRVKVPGFRPGKVPRRILENHYRHAVEQEVLQELVPTALSDAMTQEGISPIGQPQIDEVNIQQGEPLRLVATAQVLPEFAVGDYRGWQFERRVMQIEPSHIDRQMEQLRERHAELHTVSDRPIAEGDHAIINYQAMLGGAPMPDGTGTNVALEVGAGRFLSEIEQGLVGLQQGDEKTISVAFAEDFHEQSLAGKTVDFRVSVVEMKEKILPQLDDDFARSYEEEDTLEALRERTHKELEATAQQNADTALRRDVLAKLVASNSIEVPDILIQEHLRQLYLYHRRLETGQEPSPEDSHIDVEPLREVFGEQALESIRGQLILNRLETDLGVTVTPDDIDAEVASMAAQTAQNPNALKQQLERRGGLDTIRGRLQERQVFQALIDQMQITDRVVSEAELAPAADETATEL